MLKDPSALERAYSLPEVAPILGFTNLGRLRKKVKDRIIPGFYKAGRQWMIRHSKLYQYIESLENENTATV